MRRLLEKSIVRVYIKSRVAWKVDMSIFEALRGQLASFWGQKMKIYAIICQKLDLTQFLPKVVSWRFEITTDENAQKAEGLISSRLWLPWAYLPSNPTDPGWPEGWSMLLQKYNDFLCDSVRTSPTYFVCPSRVQYLQSIRLLAVSRKLVLYIN